VHCERSVSLSKPAANRYAVLGVFAELICAIAKDLQLVCYFQFDVSALVVRSSAFKLYESWEAILLSVVLLLVGELKREDG